ncbi:MAG: bifunctional UDP-N-acetylglucosamine diphosphorylase/glucosamine-1-phosphate N-acetyltransferase GlmU [Alphaproteobacteria bacterium]|nr:bifunctional UDP-N-acetylglucosamine diphosphorylase/glucosamine-1-phosphate N-acetyltransferase GlmU [Alphaproteobacteria bacterium]
MTATAVILAAGFGTRMKSALPKTLHKVAGKPMLRHLIDSCAEVFDRIVVVVGPETEAVGRAAAPWPAVVQVERLGTAHAALQAEAHFGEGEVAVLYADNPLITPATLRRLLDRRAQGDIGLALLAMRPTDPAKYGRVIGAGGFVERIVEYKDATEAERAVGLCNAGVLCADAGRMLAWLRAVKNDNEAGEYYLTDTVALACAEGALVAAVEAPESELLGINSRAEQARAEAEVQKRLRAAAMDAGVTLIAPETVFFAMDTVIGNDVIVEPNVVFGPGVRIESGAHIRAFSHLEGCVVQSGAIIGPYARLRPGADIGAGAHIGNFVEVKAASIGAGAKANHLSYIGDASVGPRTNIGAGTITCNYDGFSKFRTTIGADAFIGSNSILVAPVTIGDGAITTAGSVITADVEPDAMAFGRARQEVRPGRAAEFRARRKKEKK